MPYLGNDLQVAQPSYRNIDDISGSFNSSTTSFPLLVSGSAPVPFPINSNQCLISVAGVVQRPDDSGTEGFRISGGNIIFSSAPSTGADFFGVILAGADYVNVGANFPSGSAAAPSITFDSDLDTGIYNSAANQVSVSTAGSERLRIDSAGQVEVVSLGTASAPAFSFTSDSNTGIYSPGADQVAISTGGSGRLFVDSSGRVGIGTTSPGYLLDVASSVAQVGNSTDAFIQYKSTAGNWHVGANSSNAYVFYSGTYGSGTERARIDSSGRLLVGTSSARTAAGITSPFQVEGSGVYDNYCVNIIANTNVGAAEAPALIFGRSRGTSNGSVTAVQNGDRLGSIAWTGANGSNLSNLGGLIECYIDGAVSGGGANDMPGRLVFSTTADGASSPTERMRIGSTGRVTIQNNAGSYDAGGSGPGLEIFAGLEIGRYSYHFGAYVTAGSVGPYIRGAQNSNWASPINIALLHSAGSSFWSNLLPATDNTYSCGGSGARWTAIWAANGTIQTSDIRDKTEIRAIENGIDFIKRLRPITYKWKIGGYEIERDEDGAPIPDENGNPRQHPVPGNRTHWGFASQEVKAVTDEFGIDFGGWVLTDKDDPDSQQALRYDQFIAPLTKALQEALEKIETLEQRLADAGIA